MSAMHTTQQASLGFPKSGLAGLKDSWRFDLLAGFQVFLIALPLCLGIAMASRFPPMAGLIAAMVGGLLVSRINGSYVTISGPAAGLIVVTLGAVESLSQGDPIAGYHRALAAIVCAGLLQVLLGLLKAGRFVALVPASVVHGMLAAIGVIIMIKQFYVLIDVKAEGELLDNLAALPQSLLHANPEIANFDFLGTPKTPLKALSVDSCPHRGGRSRIGFGALL
jgi:MFS superfamily sulfate permease-like transporter